MSDFAPARPTGMPCVVQPRQTSGFAGTLHSQADHTQVTSQSTPPAAKLLYSPADQLQPPPLCIGGDLHKPKLSGHRHPKPKTARQTRTSSYAACVAFCCRSAASATLWRFARQKAMPMRGLVTALARPHTAGEHSPHDAVNTLL